MSQQSVGRQLIGSPSEVTLVAAMMGILLVLFTPIPSQLLDFLLLLNVSFVRQQQVVPRQRWPASTR